MADGLLNMPILVQHGDMEKSPIDVAGEYTEALARMPKLGVLCAFRSPALRRLRRWPVKGFLI